LRPSHLGGADNDSGRAEGADGALPARVRTRPCPASWSERLGAVTGEVGRLQRSCPARATNADTGIGRGDARQRVPIVGIHHRREATARRPDRPGASAAETPLIRPLVKAVFEVRHQAEIPGESFPAYRSSLLGEPRPWSAVVIPVQLSDRGSDFEQPSAPPLPLFRRGGVPAGASACWPTKYHGWGSTRGAVMH